MKDFTNSVVVITGGATGIGFGLAKGFGREGARIVIASRRAKRVAQAVDELTALGIEARGTVCDVSAYQSVEALADFAWDAFGRVDVLVNNAGVGPSVTRLVDLSPAQFERVMDINLYGTWYGAKVFVPRMTAQGTPCAVFNLGSENSLFSGVPRGGEYVVSKHAVHALTELLAEEAPDFMHVGLICPGWVDSEIGGERGMPMAMPTDEFIDIIMPQLRTDAFYIVSHSYNMVPIDERYDAIKAAYATWAPRSEGDQEYDVRTLMGRRPRRT